MRDRWGLNTAVGAVLYDERRGQDLTLDQVAAMAAVNKTTVSRVEHGTINASAPAVQAVAAALDLPLPLLLRRAARELEQHPTGEPL